MRGRRQQRAPRRPLRWRHWPRCAAPRRRRRACAPAVARQATDHVQHVLAEAPVARHRGAQRFDVDAEHRDTPRPPRSCPAASASRSASPAAAPAHQLPDLLGFVGEVVLHEQAAEVLQHRDEVHHLGVVARRTQRPARCGRPGGRGRSVRCSASAPRRRQRARARRAAPAAACRTPSRPTSAIARRIVSTGPLPATCVPCTCAEFTARSSSKRERHVLQHLLGHLVGALALHRRSGARRGAPTPGSAGRWPTRAQAVEQQARAGRRCRAPPPSRQPSSAPQQRARAAVALPLLADRWRGWRWRAALRESAAAWSTAGARSRGPCGAQARDDAARCRARRAPAGRPAGGAAAGRRPARRARRLRAARAGGWVERHAAVVGARGVVGAASPARRGRGQRHHAHLAALVDQRAGAAAGRGGRCRPRARTRGPAAPGTASRRASSGAGMRVRGQPFGRA